MTTGLLAFFFLVVTSVGLLPASEVTKQLGLGPEPAAAYSWQVEQWRPEVQAACGVGTYCEARIMYLISCESGGDPNAVSYHVNPGTGTHDYGLLQISTIWGGQNMGPVEQIHWTAANLDTVWWAC